MRRTIQLGIFILLTLVTTTPTLLSAELNPPSSSYLQELTAEADQKSLQDKTYWHVLLHYRSSWFGWESEVDDPAFFLAREGKNSPRAELQATLAAFFRPTSVSTPLNHPQCRFIARYTWLREQLNINLDRIPSPSCPLFEKWVKEINPKSATLIFPYYYLDAPASMFGHTLLRINTANPGQPALLSYAVNYAALVDREQTGLIEYGFKGITGGFKGVFTIAPYYLSVRSYNDMEQRDIWEYDLNFSPLEIRRMVLHLWELKQTFFDYYFFRENCSYHLLSLFEAARPGLQLRTRYMLWTLPADTVRDMISESGLVSHRAYRPSRLSRFHQQLAAMTELEKQLSLSIIRTGTLSFTEKWDNLELASRARILDLMADHTALQHSEETAHLREQILIKRAALQVRLPAADYPAVSSSPETGHATTMAAISSGQTRNNNSFRGLSLRLSLHGLLDRDSGYIPNNSISFIHARVRQSEGDTDPQLHELSLVKIISLATRDSFNSGFSWKLFAGWQQIRLSDGEVYLMFEFNPGGGVGFSVPGGILYTLGEFSYRHGNPLDIAGHAAFGLTGGYLSTISRSWKGHLVSTFSYPAVDGELPDLRQQAGLSYTPFRNHALRLDWRRENQFNEHEASYRFFF